MIVKLQYLQRFVSSPTRGTRGTRGPGAAPRVSEGVGAAASDHHAGPHAGQPRGRGRAAAGRRVSKYLHLTTTNTNLQARGPEGRGRGWSAAPPHRPVCGRAGRIHLPGQSVQAALTISPGGGF